MDSAKEWRRKMLEAIRARRFGLIGVAMLASRWGA